MHGVQGNKLAKPDWYNENIYKTLLQFMYVGMFNDPKKATWQTRHIYEQEFGDIRGLPAQNGFP